MAVLITGLLYFYRFVGGIADSNGVVCEHDTFLASCADLATS